MNESLGLVADRDGAVQALLREALEERQVIAVGARSAAEALEVLRARSIDLLFLDLDAPATSVLELISRARALHPQPLMLGLAAADPEAAARRALQSGLFDVLAKPLTPERVRFCVDRALDQMKLRGEERRLREALQVREGFRDIVGRSAAIERLRDQVVRLAPTDLSVWLCGEPGTGKTLAARALHDRSTRAGEPFVVVDCSALTRAEWDAQWTADSGSGGARERLLLQVRGGTLYLDQAAALHPDLQEKLAATLARWARDPGAASARELPRLLAGSVEDPERAVQRGLLLPSLQRSLAQGTLFLPALRQRREDVAPLGRHFVAAICEINRIPSIRLASESLRMLEGYPWPGNVRELRQAMEHAVILAAEGVIRPADLPERIREADAAALTARRGGGRFRGAKRAVVDAFERSYLSDLLARHRGNVTAAAQEAGMLRSALQRLLRKHRLKSAEFRRRRAERPRSDVVENELD